MTERPTSRRPVVGQRTAHALARADEALLDLLRVERDVQSAAAVAWLDAELDAAMVEWEQAHAKGRTHRPFDRPWVESLPVTSSCEEVGHGDDPRWDHRGCWTAGTATWPAPVRSQDLDRMVRPDDVLSAHRGAAAARA